MNDRYLDRDLELISAYIDSRLSPVENAKVKERLQSDSQFSKLFNELVYTRRLLRALPQKRAPRNFTLAENYKKAPRRVAWLQPAMSFVSVAAAATLVIVFASSYLLGGARNTALEAAAPQAADLRAMEDSAESASPPIINWIPMLGMGGGGEDTAFTGIGGGGAGGPGWDVSAPVEELPAESEPLPESPAESEEAPLTALAEPEESDAAAKTAAQPDLSTLILGVPDAETQGELLTPVEQMAEVPSTRKAFPVTPVMVASGIIALLAGIAAILLRRR